MELAHSFSLPLPVERAWEEFQDIGALAACFPGATVTEADDDGFAGSVKVKLGPIALVYNGAGTFVEKDGAARRMVIDAKGKDKRGNGTAGAHVVLQMSATGTGTDVQVTTELAITGKPAQFGRGVMQDVSDKLLGQFVTCLEQRHATPATPATAATAATAPTAGAGDPATHPPTPAEPLPAPVVTLPARDPGQDALDLGGAALPVLVRAYGPWLAGLLVVLVLASRLRRRVR